MILNGELDGVSPPGREIAPRLWSGINVSVDLDAVDVRGPVSIGSSARIEDGATIVGPAVIGRNSIVEAGARIESSVIADYTRISGFADIVGKIVAATFCVDCQGRAIDLAAAGCAFVVDDSRERRRWTDEQRALIDFLREQALGTGAWQ
jgi:mannose-1-phosphate guanylyltransferase